MTKPKYVGIDISKDNLDLIQLPQETAARFEYDDFGLRKIVTYLKRRRPALIVMEATGGYESRAAAELAAAGLPVAIVDPRQVRNYARALGVLAKTDALDARVLARFARDTQPKLSRLPEPEEKALKALVKRRRQLSDMLVAEKNRLQRIESIRVEDSLNDSIRFIKNQLKELDDQIKTAIRPYTPGGPAGAGTAQPPPDRQPDRGGPDEPGQRFLQGPPDDNRRQKIGPKRPLHGRFGGQPV